MKDGYYFVIKLTENEHDCVSYNIQEYCESNNVEFKYYRKLKTGHIPMLRECKVVGNRKQISKFKKFLDDEFVTNYIIPDYWKESKEAIKRLKNKYTKEEFAEFEKYFLKE